MKQLHDALGPEAALRILNEARAQHEDLGIPPQYKRATAVEKVRRAKQTHVVVGDHPPEPKSE